MGIKDIKNTMDKFRKKYSGKEKGFSTQTTSEIQKKKDSIKKGYVIKALLLSFAIVIVIALFKFITEGFHKTVPGATIKIEDSIESDGGDPSLELLKDEVERLKKSQEATNFSNDEKLKQFEIESQQKIEQLKKDLKAAEEKNNKLAEEKANANSVDEEQIASLRNELLAEIKNVKDMQLKEPLPARASSGEMSSSDKESVPNNIVSNSLADSIKNNPKPSKPKVTLVADNYSIENIGTPPNNKKGLEDPRTGEEVETFDLMLGLSEALLVTGVDAPTFAQGSANPKPVMLSFSSPILIANDRSINIRECTGLGSAFGNMNTKRAEITITRINCIIEKGNRLYKVSEQVQGHIIGEDGSFGVKGRLVDSGSKMVMRQMQVGFLQGVGDAFQAAVQPPVTINSYGTANSEVYSLPSGKSAAGYGMAQGANTGLNALVEYYKAMMDGLYPYISVRGGRTVGVLWQGGEELKVTAAKLLDIDGNDYKGNTHKQVQDSLFQDEELQYDSW